MYRRRYIRFFISSTFQDMERERDWLADILHKLSDEYQHKAGWQIEYVDLRWGISEQDGIDNRTMTICKAELKQCQKLSPRPNFIVLLGERYGWIPLPEVVPNSIGKYLKHLNKTFVSHYRQDFNNLSVVKGGKVEEGPWILMPYKGNDLDPQWRLKHTEKPLLKAFEQVCAVMQLTRDADCSMADLHSSATEQEIWHGALSVPDADKHVVAYFRSFPAEDNAVPSAYRAEENLDRQMRLKERLRKHLSKANILEEQTSWLHYQSESYEKHFKVEMERRIRKVIDEEIARTNIAEPTLYETELAKKALYAEEKAKQFSLRKDELSQIKRFLTEDTEHSVLWIDGESGVGKSTLLCKVYSLLSGGKEAQLLSDRRFSPFYIRCGLTQLTKSDKGVLDLLYKEVYEHYDSLKNLVPPASVKDLEVSVNHPQTYKAEEYKRWRNLFYAIEKEGASNLVLIIDSPCFLDADSIDTFSSLRWLHGYYWEFNSQDFAKLGKSVKIIICSAQSFHLQKRGGLKQISLKGLEVSAAKGMLLEMMKRQERTLGKEQQDSLYSIFNKKPSPQLMRVLADYAVQFIQSWVKVPFYLMNEDYLLDDIIGNLHTRHNSHIIDVALTALALSEGINDEEMIEFLSTDEILRQQFEQTALHKWHDSQRIPPIYWRRLSHELYGIVEYGNTIYGEANVIKQDKIRKHILRCAREKNSPKAEAETNMWEYTVSLLYHYYAPKWKEENLHAIYELPRLTFYQKGTQELLDLLLNLEYSSLFVQYFGQCINDAFMLLYNGDSIKDATGYAEPDLQIQLETLRSWLSQNAGRTAQQIRLMAFNTSDTTFMHQFRGEQLSCVALVDAFRNILGQDGIVYRTPIYDVTPIAMSEDTYKILYRHKYANKLVLFDRQCWKTTEWESEESIVSVGVDDSLSEVCVLSKRKVTTLSLADWSVLDCYEDEMDISCLSFHPGGSLWAIGVQNYLIVWDTKKKEEKYCFNFDAPIRGLRFSQRGNTLWVFCGKMVGRLSIIDGSNNHCFPDFSKTADVHIPKEEDECVIYAASDSQCFMSYGDWTVGQFCYEDKKWYFENYPYLIKRNIGSTVRSALYNNEVELYCWGADIMSKIVDGQMVNVQNIPEMMQITKNMKYGLTDDGNICDLEIVANKTFKTQCSNETTMFDMHRPMMGPNALTASNAGDTVVCSLGVWDSESVPHVLAVTYTANDWYCKKIVPFYTLAQNLRATSAVSPSGHTFAVTPLEEGQDLILYIYERDCEKHNEIISPYSTILGEDKNYSIRTLQWSSDGKWLFGMTWQYIYNMSNHIFIFSREGKIINVLKDREDMGSLGPAMLQILPSNRYAVKRFYFKTDTIDLETGDALKTIPYNSSLLWPNDFLVHPSGNWVLTLDDGAIVVHDAISKERLPKAICDGCQHLLAVSPSGRYLFVTRKHEGDLLYRLDLADGKLERVGDVEAQQVVCTYADDYIYVHTPQDDLLLIDTCTWNIVQQTCTEVVRKMMQNTQRGLVLANMEGTPMMMTPKEHLRVNETAYVTITRHWNFENHSYDNPTATCPHCGHNFTPRPRTVDIVKGKYVPQSLKYDKVMAGNHELFKVCPHCKGKLIFNYYMA